MSIPAAKEVPPHHRARLIVARASDGDAEPASCPPGTEWPMDRSPIVFGMSTAGLPDKRDVALYIDGLGRPHAYFEWRDDGWYVCDLSSPGGTWVGGAKVTSKKVVDGDRIALGSIGDRNADGGSGVVLELSRR